MTTQTLKAITHKEVLAVMDRYDVLLSVDRFTAILQWCEQRTLEWVAETEDAQRRALAHTALDRMVANAEEPGLYDDAEAK
jgi:hypothetical protein